MKRGRKPEPPAIKQARGTYQPCRDDAKVSIVTPGDPPQMPDYLNSDAVAVWQEEIARVMVCGADEIDSSEFAAYCSLEASIRKAFSCGDVPPITALAEARKKRELFGLAGPKSRIQQRDDGKQTNPFAKL